MDDIKDKICSFVNGFNQLISNTEGEHRKRSETSLESLYFAICDLLSELGYSLISLTVLEELFVIYQEELAQPLERDELMLSFVLQLLNANDPQKYGLVQAGAVYQHSGLSLPQLFEIIYRHRLFTIMSPYQNGSSVVYERDNIIRVLDQMEILEIKQESRFL